MRARPRGYFLKGTHAPNKSGGLQFQGFTTLNDLENMGFLQPSVLAKIKLRDIQHDPGATANKLLRDSIQRPFDAERLRNAVEYRNFLIDTEVHGQMGNAPAITLLIPEANPQDDGIVVPYRSAVIAVDGETQSEARFMMRDQYPETGTRLIKITVYSNEPQEYGQIILVNYNDNGHKVKQSIVKSIDPRGHINQMITTACSNAKLDRDVVVNRFGTGGRGQHVVGLDQLQAAAVGAASGVVTPWDKQYSQINFNGGISNTEQCIDIVTMLLEAVHGGNKELQRADPLIWQVVGSQLRNGRTISDLQLSRAAAAVDNQRRMGVNKRLSKAQKIAIMSSII